MSETFKDGTTIPPPDPDMVKANDILGPVVDGGYAISVTQNVADGPYTVSIHLGTVYDPALVSETAATESEAAKQALDALRKAGFS